MNLDPSLNGTLVCFQSSTHPGKQEFYSFSGFATKQGSIYDYYNNKVTRAQ